MAYDDADHLVATACASPDGARSWETIRVFFGDELTEVTRVYELLGVESRTEEETWTLGEVVTRTVQIDSGASGSSEVVETFESEGFRFLGHPLDPEQAPAAPDSLVSRTSTRTGSVETFEVDYTFDGPPREGTRTRIGSDGSIVEFRCDAAGRLVEQKDRTYESDPESLLALTNYVYEGDLLSERRHQLILKGASDDTSYTFEHDVPGNLIRMKFTLVDPPIKIASFDYSCW